MIDKYTSSLVTQLRYGQTFDRQTGDLLDQSNIMDDAADEIEKLTTERDEYQQAADEMAAEHKVERDSLMEHIQDMERERDSLHQQLSEARALIEASRKQEPVAFKDKIYGNLHHQDYGYGFPLFASPMVADDVSHVNCDTCVYHYKAADQKPCNTCIHSGDFVNNFEPRFTGGQQ